MVAEERTIGLDEVAQHNRADDLWVAIDGAGAPDSRTVSRWAGGVYDLTRFGMLHPGGLPPLLELAGTECTAQFYGLHRAAVLQEPKYAKLRIGRLAGQPQQAAPARPLPYGESMGTFRLKSPYYKESHHRLRAAIRATYDKLVAPFAPAWDENGDRPSDELNQQLGDAGLLACLIASEPAGPGLLRRWGLGLPSGLDPEEHDPFHGLVEAEEAIVGTRGCYGVKDGLLGGCAGIGLPPIIKFGSELLIEKFAKPVCFGSKRIALAISEPYAGSDVGRSLEGD